MAYEFDLLRTPLWDNHLKIKEKSFNCSKWPMECRNVAYMLLLNEFAVFADKGKG